MKEQRLSELTGMKKSQKGEDCLLFGKETLNAFIITTAVSYHGSLLKKGVFLHFLVLD